MWTLVLRTVAFTTIGAVGFVSNLLTLIVIVQKKGSSSFAKTSHFFINQCIIDMLASVMLILSFDNFGPVMAYPDLREGDPWSEFVCRFWISNSHLWPLLLTSTSNLMAVTIERYLLIVHPIWHKVSFTHTKTKVALVAVWIAGSTVALSATLSYAKIIDGVCYLHVWSSEVIARTVGLAVIFCQFFFPVITLVYCYTRMILSLRKRSVGVAPQNTLSVLPHDQQREDKNQTIHRNLIKTLLVVSLVFIFCWAWDSVLFFLVNVGLLDGETFQSELLDFCLIMIYLNTAGNPFIYMVCMKGFRQDVWRIIRRCTRKITRRPGIEESVTVS